MTGLDTNILIYACDERDPRLQTIALDLIHSTRDGILFWQVACEFIAASRKLGDQGFSNDDAWQRLNELMHFFRWSSPVPPYVRKRERFTSSNSGPSGTR